MKKISKILNKIFNDKTFLQDLSKDCENITQIQYIMGQILSYYISTRDNKIYSYKNLRKLIWRPFIPKNLKNNESNSEALTRNIIYEGFVTHSFNGYFLRKILKNGLGSRKNHDEKLEAELNKLEQDLGTSKFLKQQTNDSTEIYYTSPGANSIFYATNQSPERLFEGPLNQGSTPLPVVVGESKFNYYMRVIRKKIENVTDPKKKQSILENARNVITKLCSYPPQITLIPIFSKKYTLNANLATVKNKTLTLKEYLEREADGNMQDWAISTFFSDCLGANNPNNCSNLVSTGVKVPAKALQFIGVPDSFDLAQILAKNKGFLPGEKFDLHTLEKVVDSTDKEKTDETKTINPIIKKSDNLLPLTLYSTKANNNTTNNSTQSIFNELNTISR